jgi:protein O-mannosyl-transferase
MLVTWPFVMLLLDYWPLRRLVFTTPNSQRSTILRLVGEKIPFFVLAASASVVTFWVQQHGGAMRAVEKLSLSGRCVNALVSYSRYLGKLFWPADLAVFYPLPAHWPVGKVVLAGGLTLGLSVLVWAQRRRRPYLLMGWLWFLGTLVPVIGLVQVGGQAMADRYTYLPSLGVLLLTVWGGCELIRRWKYQAMASSVAGGTAVVLCLALTQRQLGYWQNSELLFQHALDVTEDNVLAHKNLGDALYQQGHIVDAIGQFQEALRLNPDDAMSHYDLGTAFSQQGRNVEAIGQFQEALRLNPDDAMSHYNLGVVFYQIGRLDEAIVQYRQALRFESDYADAHNNLGVALCKKGQRDEAISQMQEAIRLKPDFAQAHFNLGTTLCQQLRIAEGIGQFQEAVRLKPDDARFHYSLGLAFYQQGRTDEAVGQFQEALKLEPGNADARQKLADALARKTGSLPPLEAPANR